MGGEKETTPETLGQAAARLLRSLEQRTKKTGHRASNRPDQFANDNARDSPPVATGGQADQLVPDRSSLPANCRQDLARDRRQE